MSALRGLKVIDLSRHAPGPYCTMLLADLGADVIVVEQPPGQGRSVSDEIGVSRREKLYNPVGRNKRSITLNLKDRKMRDVCLALIKDTDIVVEGFRPGVVRRLGLDYETLGEINPKLIYCSVSGYGQTGPYRDLVGHDLNYISLAGILGMIGTKGGPPAIPVNIIGDYAGGGLFAAFSILAAVISRAQTGEGQYIDMAMSDGSLSLANLAACAYLSTGTAPKPEEYFLNGSLPCYNVYQTADAKWISIACTEPWFWARLCQQLGCEQFAKEQYNEELFREMFAFLRTTFKSKKRDAWFKQLGQEEICVAPVYGIDEALEDPHNISRNMVVELEDAEYGPIKQIGIAPKFSRTPGEVKTLPPTPGQHTEEILAEAGFSIEQIAQFPKPEQV